jgi:PQQ-like domain
LRSFLSGQRPNRGNVHRDVYYNLRENRNLAKNRTTLSIALILTFTMVVSLAAFPSAHAQFEPQINYMTSYAFIGARPNPAGVGQQVLFHFGITATTQNATESFKGLTITVTKPDGTTLTLGPFKTDSTGGSGTIWVPDATGNYILQTHFPAQWYNFSGMTDYGPMDISTFYSAADSDKLTLVVQEEQTPTYPGVPLPTEYWDRPIDAQSREWYTISGSWLGLEDYLYSQAYVLVGNRFVENNNDAPETAHVLWTKPLTIGGLVGGDAGLANSINHGAVGFGIGDAYEGIWSSRLIVAGRLYYEVPPIPYPGFTASAEPIEYHCVDLHTGQEMWTKTFLYNQSIAFGQLLYYQGFNYMGTFAYLYVVTGGYDYMTGLPLPATWTAFDAYTGNWAFTVMNIPAGTILRDANGGLYELVVDQVNGWMALWNMTQFIESSATGYYVGGGSWGNVVNGMTFDAGADTTAAKEAYSWNVTIPAGLPGIVQTAFFGDRVIGSDLVTPFGAPTPIPTPVTVWGLSLKEGQEGQVLFNKQWASPSHWNSGNETISWATWSQESEVGILWSKERRQHYGVSLKTGELLWGPTPSQNYLDIYEGTGLTTHLVAYDKLYACGVAGILYCYDAQTGALLWNYTAKDPYTESMFSSNWWIGIVFITDGKLYIGSGEHSPNQPLPRGAPFLCLNATTGAEIWKVNGLFRQTGWGGLAIIGDSIMATMDTYDQRVYAVGKGPSATTVSAPETTQPFGTEIIVKGTVNDISPGTEEYTKTARFPNGVPAVSDDSMSDWMLYVYKQFALPTNTKGVEVVVSVLDPNSNYYEVGRATSDATGSFSMTFVPEVPGKYTIVANFAGSGGYYGSFAETFINVAEAPAATPAPTQAPASLADQYILPGIGGIIVAIAIVGVVLALIMLRKK